MSLKDYEIQSKLGSGSFGVVYKAKPKGGELICVLKEVQLKSMDKKMREWAMNQVKIMKNIDSEYIVKYKQSFIEKQKLYICMEYCSGGDLAQFLKGQIGKPVAQDTVWKFALQIMLGLRDLHQKKILHRDIKSMNVFLNQNKMIKIGDLGVAKTMTGDFARTIVGTPYYLSPEMCQQKPYNEKTDVWAMGCLIYELCTGRHPFQANTQAALALKIVMGKYAPIPSLYSQLMSWLIRVCLQIDYKRRPNIQYILDQANVINMAKKVGIQLSQNKQLVVREVNKQKIQVISKQNQKAEKVQNKFSKNPVIDNKVTKKNFKQEVKRPSIQKNKAKSIEKNGKGANIGANQKDIKIEQKVYANIHSKNMPPKQVKKNDNVQIKKVDNKLNNKAYVSPTSKNSPPIKSQIQQKAKVLQNPIQKGSGKQPQSKRQQVIQVKKQSKQGEILLPLQTKQRKSVQQIVDDDQLFNDFGITPEKLSTLNEKFQFKKVNPINWNIQQQQDKKQEKTLFRQLPTIKTPSSCELVEISCKQVEDQEELVSEEIDDNAPYKSDQQLGNTSEQENLLIQNSQQVEEDAELKKKEKLLILQKRMSENDKRRRQLLELKKQREKQIVAKLSLQKYEKIKRVMKDGSDDDIQKILMKQCSSVSITAQFYKIIYNQMQIQRCQDNISKCVQTIKQLDAQK